MTFIEYTSRGFAKHFTNAEKVGANVVVLIGEDELNDNTVYVKNLTTKIENKINIEDL